MSSEWRAVLDRDEAATWWLDRETGALFPIPRDDWEAIARLEGAPAAPPSSPAMALALQVQAQPKRYLQAPLTAEQELADGRAFVSSVLSAVVQRQLQGVLEGPRPMERLRALLARHPHELARWQTFRALRLRQRIQRWLDEV
ncbi:MAG: hypothetical protein GX605_07000 [Chloroflexi bacterium]|nr:hypothetical protein [Chloroflexota bacterium]